MNLEARSMGPAKTVAEVRHQFPAKYIESIKNNAQIKECCRDVDSNFVEIFQTPKQVASGLEGGDLLVITCNVCGAKHRRYGAAGQ